MLVGVNVGTTVWVAVGVCDGVGVTVAVPVLVEIGDGVRVDVGVWVGRAVGVAVGVGGMVTLTAKKRPLLLSCATSPSLSTAWTK